jgi:leader peptidase (prepilin peptidase)/N-methyltransferase
MTFGALQQVLILLFGAAIGSFQNVLIDRLATQSTIGGRSRCENCQRQIANIHNVPIFSYLLLRGKCHNCGAKIGIRTLLIEILTPVIFLIGLSITQNLWELSIWLIFTIFGIPIFIIDLKTSRIPNALNLVLFLSIAILVGTQALASSNWHNFYSSLIQSLLLSGFYFLLRVISRGGMGLGDVKFAASIGLISGYFGKHMVFNATYGAFIFGTFVSLYFLAKKGYGRKSKIPFGPYMVLGMYFAFLFYYLVQLESSSQFLRNL